MRPLLANPYSHPSLILPIIGGPRNEETPMIKLAIPKAFDTFLTPNKSTITTEDRQTNAPEIKFY